MKTQIKILMLLLISAVVFDSCKKGEDDPMISLKSRKARVVGEWKVTSITSKYTSTSGGATTTSSFTANGTTYTDTYTDATGTTTTAGTFTAEYTFDKDGTYKSSSTQDTDFSTETGTWNFTHGVGEIKNRSQITMYGTSYTSSSGGSSTYTGNYVDGAYDLKELRNKKMVWYMTYASTYSGTTPGSSNYEVEIVLEAK